MILPKILFVLTAALLLPCLARGADSAEGPATMAAAHDYPYHAIPFTAVHAEDAFWAPRMETNRSITIPAAFAKCEEVGRMDNFRIAAGRKKGTHRGEYPFDDTDVYKVLEGASYALALKKDPKLDAYLDELIDLIAAAQEKDGYLYTCRTNNATYLEHWTGPTRWSNLARSHELYNCGHLYEAAAAHYMATGKRSLLDVAMKNVDLLDRTFGPGKLELPPGHQIAEMGLARLYRITGDERCIRLARFFLEQRGRGGRTGNWGPYNQDHLPVLQQDKAVGHAVRAGYMYAGMADVAALTGDAAYAAAIRRLWTNVVSAKMHFTGGLGARGDGESYGDDYELPNLDAYCETCAAIAGVYWNHRLFLLEGDGKYIDILERTLYNAVIAGVSLDGARFFYNNPLASNGEYLRSPWFGCACCPGNICRFQASVPGYAYAQRGREIYANLYFAGRAEMKVDDVPLIIEQQTRYPWDGSVRLTLKPGKPAEFTLCLRIPGWARGEAVPSDLYRFEDAGKFPPIAILINGEPMLPQVDRGYARIQRTWREGDVVELNLPMPVRRVLCNEKVAENLGRVALQRGPIVYCAEWPDNDKHVANLLLPDEAPLASEFRPNLLNGVQVITGQAWEMGRDADGKTIIARKDKPFAAIPYYAWAHRGAGEMAVWIARDLSAARPLPLPTLAMRSKAMSSRNADQLAALCDKLVPQASDEKWQPHLDWLPAKGSTEWVQYEFDKPQRISQVEVYWYMDPPPDGAIDLPQSWQLFYRTAGQWKPVPNPDGYPALRHRFNTVKFDAVEADAVKIEVQLKPNASAGIHEWRVE